MLEIMLIKAAALIIFVFIFFCLIVPAIILCLPSRAMDRLENQLDKMDAANKKLNVDKGSHSE